MVPSMHRLLLREGKIMDQTQISKLVEEFIYTFTLKNKRVNQHLKGPRSDSVFMVLHLPYYPAGANSLKC